MKLNAIQKAGLMVAAVLVCSGSIQVLFPRDRYIFYGRARYKGHEFPSWFEHITKAGDQVYGLVAIASGAGLAGIVFYRGRK